MKRRSRVGWYLPLPGDEPRSHDDGPPPLAEILAMLGRRDGEERPDNVVNLAAYKAAKLGGHSA